MKREFLAVMLTAPLFLALAAAQQYGPEPVCPEPWHCEVTTFRLHSPKARQPERKVEVSIRHGYLLESGKEFRGNVLYLQGLGDSMLNHGPLFSKLTEEGYRVIAFDYPGQGGSSGSMNDTRIRVIPEIGKAILAKHGVSPKLAPTFLLGWSTGGLAAYAAAARGDDWFQGVALIAPGIAPRVYLRSITIESLTSDRYGYGIPNPHVDPIRPGSPRSVPSFSIDLLDKSLLARGGSWKIPAGMPGLVLFGTDDDYVDNLSLFRAVNHFAPHFEIRGYEGARHEIDNEEPGIRDRAHEDIIAFLNRVSEEATRKIRERN